MKTQRLFTAIFLAIAIALNNVSAAFAMPPLPSSFRGTVKVDGANVALGTVVSARINGVEYSYTTVQVYNGDTVYSFDVPGDDLSTPGVIEGGAEGNTIVFYIGDLVTDQTGTWHSGTSVTLNLTASTPPTCYALTLSHTGQGSNPVAAPANSTGCSTDYYVASATINLSGAVPTSGWQISSWSGTYNNSSTASTNTATMPASALTVAVNYTALPTHTVTFNSNGGTGSMSPQVANVPTALTANAFTWTGYTFNGWNTQADGNGTNYADGVVYSFAADLSLYAKWSALPNHTVTFNSNGGSGSMSNQVANVPTALTANAFTRTGYTFIGWNTKADGNGTNYANGQIYSFAADLSLYAKWTALPNHTVTFNANGGTGSMAPQIANVLTALTSNAFTRAATHSTAGTPRLMATARTMPTARSIPSRQMSLSTLSGRPTQPTP